MGGGGGGGGGGHNTVGILGILGGGGHNTVADLGERVRGSEPLLSSENNYADWLEQLGWLAKSG